MLLHCHHHPKTLSSLTPTEQSYLAHLLTLPSHHLTTTGQPSKAWLTHQAYLIADTTITPYALRRAPESLLARFVGFVVTSTTSASQQRAVLCPAHQGLNSHLVRAVFGMLVEEVGCKARPLRRFVRHPARYHLKEEEGKVVCALVDRLLSVQGLWSAPLAHGAYARKVRGFMEEGGCEACILAIVGGDEDLLRDLWALVAGRTHRRRQKTPPVLGGLVAAWMENLEEGEKVRREAEELGRVVKRVRRAVWKHRHEKRSMRSVHKKKRKNISGYGRARDSGYGSTTGKGGHSAAWKPADDLGATLIDCSYLSSSHEKGRDGCGDDADANDSFAHTAVEYDILLRKRTTLSQSQATTLDPDIYTHSIAQDSTMEAQDGEYDVFLREKSPAGYHYQQPRASDARMSSSTLHIPPISISEEADNEYDADDDDSDYDHDELDMYYDACIQNDDMELHPVLRATSNMEAQVGRCLSLRSGLSDEAMDTRPLNLGQVDTLSQSEEAYDPAQWTDVTVATWDPRSRGIGGAENCGSSSVYSTTGTAVPHPRVLPTSTVVSSGCLRQALASRENLPWTAWPNPFVNVAPIATITHSNASQRFLCTSPSSSSASSRTVAGMVDDSRRNASLSPDHFQKALEGLEHLSIVDTGKGDIMGIPEGTVLPWESISAVGCCSCTAQLEMWREGISCD